jgi:putative ABC transport system ATP-binding protein
VFFVSFVVSLFLAFAMMELRDVTKHYLQGRREVRALRGVSLRVEAGEFVSIMGPSGSGKSTLMHLLGALDTPTSGQVFFRGRALQSLSDRELSLLRRTRIGFVFQFFNLLPTLTAVENVALPLFLAGQRRSRALGPAYEGLERVSLSGRASHFPEELSGGEMQRVAIARALVIEPEAVLCDEPTGNLDSATSKEILALLRSLPEPGKRAVVMVTHDGAAAVYGDRIVHIRDGVIDTEETVVRPEEEDGVGRVPPAEPLRSPAAGREDPSPIR